MPYLIIGIIAVIYGIIIRAAGSGTPFFLVWIFMGITLIGLSYVVRHHVLEMIPHWMCMIGKTAVILAAVIFIAVEATILTGFGCKPSETPDYIIVLGAQIRDDGPSVVLKYRLDRAAEYLAENSSVICIVSGGQGYNERVMGLK